MKSHHCLDAVLRNEPLPWAAIGASSVGLLDACEALEISELLHDHLTRGASAHDWPDTVRRELSQRAHAAAARELTRASEIADVLEALSARGVHPILLKGVALAHIVYDSPALRPHLDTDLFVRRDESETVRQVLTERGYAEPSMTDGELVFCQFQMAKTDRFGVLHVFDVHWRISTQSVFADVLTYDEVATEAVPVPTLGSCARATGGPHALLLACIHPVMHHRNTERLIWLYDIHLLVTRLPASEVNDFAMLAARKHVAAVCAHQLTIAADRFHTRVPAETLSTLRSAPEREPSALYLRTGRRWHHELLWNLRGLGRWSDRVRLLREVFLPAPRYMLNAYRLGSPGFILLPALYVHRWTYGAFKIVAGRK